MSNIFDEITGDLNSTQDKLLGPSYPYYANVKTPSELGMSDKGSIQQMTKDINGLVNYVELLVQGKSNASKTGNPLGNKFFLQTGAKCADPSGNQQDRFIYINNIPEGNIPFISSGMGVNFSEFKGLIPGAMSDLNALNPLSITQGFMEKSVPDCQQITLQTVNNDNVKTYETHYVTLTDIKNMDACSFPNKINPISGQKCKETFTNESVKVLPDDPVTQVLFATIAAIGIYSVYKMLYK